MFFASLAFTVRNGRERTECFTCRLRFRKHFATLEWYLPNARVSNGPDCNGRDYIICDKSKRFWPGALYFQREHKRYKYVMLLRAFFVLTVKSRPADQIGLDTGTWSISPPADSFTLAGWFNITAWPSGYST